VIKRQFVVRLIMPVGIFRVYPFVSLVVVRPVKICAAVAEFSGVVRLALVAILQELADHFVILDGNFQRPVKHHLIIRESRQTN